MEITNSLYLNYVICTLSLWTQWVYSTIHYRTSTQQWMSTDHFAIFKYTKNSYLGIWGNFCQHFCWTVKIKNYLNCKWNPLTPFSNHLHVNDKTLLQNRKFKSMKIKKEKYILIIHKLHLFTLLGATYFLPKICYFKWFFVISIFSVKN
jgi:hypothetical protein